MKKLFLYIFLGLFLTSNSFSNIKDFQLEGMSIGDSFLDYYTKETQKELKLIYNKNTEITSVKFKDSDFETYDEVQVSFKGINQTIVSVSGIFYVPISKTRKKFDECLKMQVKITESLKSLKPIKIEYGSIVKPTSEDFATTKINELLLHCFITIYNFNN